MTQVMLVYFVGGVTYMEIAALRFLSAQRECKSCMVQSAIRLGVLRSPVL